MRRHSFRASDRGRPRRASPTLIVGYVLAVLLPVVGMVVGVIVFSNGPRNHGIGIIALSILVAAVSYALIF